MAFKMKRGNSPQKFGFGGLMGTLGGAVLGGRKRSTGGPGAAMANKAKTGVRPNPVSTVKSAQNQRGLAANLQQGKYTGFGVAPGQVMGGQRRGGGPGRMAGMFGGRRGMGGIGGMMGGFGGGGGLGSMARRGMGGLLGGGFFKKDESSFKNVGNTGEYKESSAFQKPKKKKKKKIGGFLSRWRNRRKFFKKKEDATTGNYDEVD